MTQIIQYLVNVIKYFGKGTIPVDPSPPSDLGSPLTQDEIDFVKKLKKEIDERFTPL